MNNELLVNYHQSMSRTSMIMLLEAALKTRQYRFARQSALTWLTIYPGDIKINAILATALFGEGKADQASSICRNLIEKDPEYIEAYEQLVGQNYEISAKVKSLYEAIISSYTESVVTDRSRPDWVFLLQRVRQLWKSEQYDEAEGIIQKTLLLLPDNPLPAIFHVLIKRAQHDNYTAGSIVELYHARWPECIQLSLLLAETKLSSGEETEAVSLLHQCSVNDPAGQIPERIWGENHPYKPLWPDRMSIIYDLPVPAPVAAELGWNQLPDGEGNSSDNQLTSSDTSANPFSSTSEPANQLQEQSSNPGIDQLTPSEGLEKKQNYDAITESIQKEFDKLAKKVKKPAISHSDGRFPIYVILTTRQGLENQFGPQSTNVILDEVNLLSKTINKRPGWGTLVYLADEPACTAQLKVKPAPFNDPWKIKLSLTDLDKKLGEKGQMIGMVLIVGGPNVVPFHKLPNPTDDSDTEVPSDNPYATRDENYFIPEWPVGRLPSGNTSDAGLLLKILRQMNEYHNQYVPSTNWMEFLLSIIGNLLKTPQRLGKAMTKQRIQFSLGYTAAVWKRSSWIVYQPIGEAKKMLISPPTTSGHLSNNGQLTPASMAYFNLHGVQDGPDWYGQRDIADQSNPDYPVALNPKDILNSGQAPKVVFSEACYGANIIEKTEDTAIALKFLSSGTSAMVGSTTIAYGSVTAPLISADLLGNLFWRQIRRGVSFGEAFQLAKIGLAREMNIRQGYLDGEDQKTLISFILYGDPLASIDSKTPKERLVLRTIKHPEVALINDHENIPPSGEQIPADVLVQVKQIVDQYLPGLRDADLVVSYQKSYQTDQKGNTPGRYKANNRNTVVMLNKQVKMATHLHNHYARLTLDAKGNVLKMALSR